MNQARHLLALLLAIIGALVGGPAASRGPEVYALTEVRIIPAPGSEIERGTVVIRDGVIEAVGSDVAPPPDARILERPELSVYPGLIDAYVETPWPVKSDGEVLEGAHSNSMVRPERAISEHGLPEAAAKKLRSAGFTTVAVAPREGLFRGTSAVLNVGEGGLQQNLLRAQHAHNITFATATGGYPNSLMGSVALFRQTLLDTLWHEQAWKAYEANPAQPRPELNAAYSELAPVASGRGLVVLESDSAQGTLRNASLVQEFALQAHLVGSGDEYRWLEEIGSIGAPIVVPVDFPDTPAIPETDQLAVSLEELRQWDGAPTNLRLLLDAGVTVAVTSHRLDDPAHVLKNLHIAIDRGGLQPEQALAALTTTPARLLGIEDRAGTIAVGKMANLVITDGDLFAETPSIREVWVDGRRFEIKDIEAPEIEPAGTWELTVTTGDGQTLMATMTLEGEAAALSGTISEPSGGTIPLSRAEVSGASLEVSFDGTAYGMPGEIEFVLDIEGDRGSGSGASPAGEFTIEARRTAAPTEASR